MIHEQSKDILSTTD